MILYAKHEIYNPPYAFALREIHVRFFPDFIIRESVQLMKTVLQSITPRSISHFRDLNKSHVVVWAIDMKWPDY